MVYVDPWKNLVDTHFFLSIDHCHADLESSVVHDGLADYQHVRLLAQGLVHEVVVLGHTVVAVGQDAGCGLSQKVNAQLSNHGGIIHKVDHTRHRLYRIELASLNGVPQLRAQLLQGRLPTVAHWFSQPSFTHGLSKHRRHQFPHWGQLAMVTDVHQLAVKQRLTNDGQQLVVFHGSLINEDDDVLEGL